MVASKQFRSDLYYRLNVFPVNIPLAVCLIIIRSLLDAAAHRRNRTFGSGLLNGLFNGFPQLEMNVGKLRFPVSRVCALGTFSV
jgi:hypothetical protein